MEFLLRTKFSWASVVCIWLCVAALAADPSRSVPVSAPSVSVAPVSAAAVSSAPVLPADFAGWQMGAVTKSDDASVADAANEPVLKEFGFQRLEKATYTRDDGRSLTIKAAVFADASGAYGAFTYYQTPEMREETIGGQAAYLNNRVLFYQGNVLVDAVFRPNERDVAAQLRQLAGLLPQATDNKDKPPSLPTRLPRRSSGPTLVKNTTKYVMGPVALDRVGSPLPPSMVDFNSDAEVVIAKYEATAGDATLMLIEYPSPQIAAERLRQIDASHQVTHRSQESRRLLTSDHSSMRAPVPSS